MEKMKSNKGITLIALIVTIIILLILATVTVDIAVDGQLFNTANKAVNETNAKTVQEQNRVDELMEELNTIACEHNYGEWTIELEATCTTSGTQTRICSLCDYKDTETIEATGHTYGEYVVTKEVTCTEDGAQDVTCTKCNDKQSQVIEATGHTYSDWEITTEATTTSTGIATSTCTKCGDTQIMEIPKLETDGTIKFTIDGTEYTAEEGMSWAVWVPSTYNTGGYEVKTTLGYGYVTTTGGAKYLKPSSGSYYVQSTAIIVNGAVYTSVNYGWSGLVGS